MILRNFDYANRYFDSSLKTEKQNINIKRINGWYKNLGDKMMTIFVLENKLYFSNNSDEYLITTDHKVLIENSFKYNIFHLLENETELFSYKCYSSKNKMLNTTPFEYIDEEDFEWEKFIEKIINDENRKHNFITNLMPPAL